MECHHVEVVPADQRRTTPESERGLDRAVRAVGIVRESSRGFVGQAGETKGVDGIGIDTQSIARRQRLERDDVFAAAE